MGHFADAVSFEALLEDLPVGSTDYLDLLIQASGGTGSFSQTSSNPAAQTAGALTDNSGGSDTPDGTIGEIADIALSTSNTYTDAAVNSAVNAVVDDCANAVEELAAQGNANRVDIGAVRTEVLALVADVAAIKTALGL